VNPYTTLQKIMSNTPDVQTISKYFNKLKVTGVPISIVGTEEEAGTLAFEVLDDLDQAILVIDALHGVKEVAFDAEGVDLSRSGPLTAVSLAAVVPGSPVKTFVLDILSIGPRVWQEPQGRNLKTLLESKTVRKLTYDCRGDSDALYHQFGVTLQNVLDMQVFRQGVLRYLRGDDYRHKDGYDRPPYLQGMTKAAGVFSGDQRKMLGLHKAAPHKTDKCVWGKRPLTKDVWSYAASDALIITMLTEYYRGKNISESLMKRVLVASDKYTKCFRDLPRPVKWPRDKQKILVDVPI
jgi:hypothetical protein